MIVVSKLNTVFLKERASPEYLASINDITLGLGRAAALVMFSYLGMRLVSITHEGSWGYLQYAHRILVPCGDRTVCHSTCPVFLWGAK